MPRYNVQHPETGKWACFSSVVDDFITDWMPEKKYEKWRRKEYGIHCGTVHNSNRMNYEEAMQIIGKEGEDDE